MTSQSHLLGRESYTLLTANQLKATVQVPTLCSAHANCS